MPTPTFKQMSLQQFAQLLNVFPFDRKITGVHMHHTWRPRRSEFAGHSTIVAMWRYHTETKHWRDIAQHITIDPAGGIWLGRNWNLPPASAAGFNGNASAGPFMFEVVGDFDEGQELLDGAQRETALKVAALVQDKFALPTSSLLFHNAMSTKSCPGSSLNYTKVLEELATIRAAPPVVARPRKGKAAGPFPDEADLDIREAIERLTRITSVGDEPANAELSEAEPADARAIEAALDAAPRVDATRDSGISPAELAALRPHLVNLCMGRFSSEGEASSTREDVDALFEQSLPAAISKAHASGRKLPVLFFAHGGLVSEASGLKIAAGHINWWKQNGIYPIYFIWETGLFETIGQLLNRARQGAARDLWDITTDPIIELTARALHGPRLWGSMKSSAEYAVDPPAGADTIGGGAHYVATKLKALCDAHDDRVELYAVGHSAGSIFHSHFLSTARQLKVPTFKSAHFLAPAIRVDTFKELLAGNIGDGKAVQHLTVFTMSRDYERKDDCANIYQKSLLYLVHHALEPQRDAPILGLEESLRKDAAMKRLFGLGGSRSTLGEVVWSVSPSDSGCSASTSVTHGGFDNDAPTMNSVARRVLGKADADAIVEFPSARAIGASPRAWTDEVDWPEELHYRRPPLPAAARPELGHRLQPDAVAQMPPASPMDAAPGRRLALCVGIDKYPNPRNELAGCVADARLWSASLKRLGFSISMLTDQEATRDRIERELTTLLARSRAGDVVVFQYSGHGTRVPDLDGDEGVAGEDQALCPIDFETGALFIDDDLRGVLAKAPDGVAITCFMDCCHSGSIIRLGMGPSVPPEARRDERQRFIRPTPELVEAHARYRQALGARRGMDSPPQGRIRHVSFAACRDSESAWESDGHGDFTTHATRLLAEGVESVSNEVFAQRVLAAFGARRRQEPQLFCDEDRRALMLLQPLRGAEGVPLARAPMVQPTAFDRRGDGGMHRHH